MRLFGIQSALPKGEYAAELAHWDDVGDRFLWHFHTVKLKRDGNPTSLTWATRTEVEPGNDLAQLLTALGIPLPKTEEEAARMQPDLLYDRQLLVLVDVRIGDDGPENFVTGVAPKR